MFWGDGGVVSWVGRQGAGSQDSALMPDPNPIPKLLRFVPLILAVQIRVASVAFPTVKVISLAIN